MSNINDLAAAYVKSTIEYPHLKVITLAQWLLESGRGTSVLAVEHKNFGGLKWRDEMKGFAGPVEYEAHDGKDSYCKFESYDKFIEGYWHFLDRSPYKGWRDHSQDPVNFISFIGKIYCPANPHYSSDIMGLKDEAIAILKKQAILLQQQESQSKLDMALILVNMCNPYSILALRVPVSVNMTKTDSGPK
ncbi:MAG: glucosaminidase domain-containing protein [Candidatus Xenobiia bacterium LiM19]